MFCATVIFIFVLYQLDVYLQLSFYTAFSSHSLTLRYDLLIYISFMSLISYLFTIYSFYCNNNRLIMKSLCIYTRS